MRGAGRGVVVAVGMAALVVAADAKEIHVPRDAATVAAALAAAEPGDAVVLAPGIYREELVLETAVTLRSTFAPGGDPAVIAATVLDGGNDAGEVRERTPLTIRPAARGARVLGLTFAHGDDGISCAAEVEITYCRFVGNTDAIDYEGGGGVCAFNLFRDNRDDAIDLDGDCHVRIHHNRLIDSRDDGIEIRLEPTRAERRLEVVIEDCLISGSGEDGIQFIDYPGVTDRVYLVRNTVIRDSAKAGIGFMSESVTREDYRAAAIPERIVLANNTIDGAEYGVSASGPFVLVNHVIGNSRRAAFLGGSVESRVYRNVLSPTNRVGVESPTFRDLDFPRPDDDGPDPPGIDLGPFVEGLGLTLLPTRPEPAPGAALASLGAPELVFPPDAPSE